MKSESVVQAEVRLAAARKGMRLYRNNVGVARDQHGRPIRYGLANDSKQLNEVLKSGDLIGWRTVEITPEMVGQRIAQFVSVECKREGWKPSASCTREKAQRLWARLVNEEGGVGIILANADDL